MTHRNVTVFFVLLLLAVGLFAFWAPVPWWIFAIVVAVWLGCNVIGSALIQLNYHVKAYCANPSEKANRIALTFDDGPNEHTPRILDLLKSEGLKATFFCIGQNIDKHREILRRIVQEGHTVANHSYSHSHFFDFFRKDRVARELRDTDRLIEQVTGQKPRWFRPPYGVTNPSIRRALAVTGHDVIGWNIRSMDGVSQDADAIFNRIIQRLAPGSIVLLHDTRPVTADVLERLLPSLRAREYSVVPADELLGLNAYEN